MNISAHKPARPPQVSNRASSLGAAYADAYTETVASFTSAPSITGAHRPARPPQGDQLMIPYISNQATLPADIPAHAHMPTAIQLSGSASCTGAVTHVKTGITTLSCPLPITHGVAAKTAAAGAAKASLGFGIIKLSIGVAVLVGVSAVTVAAFGIGVYLGASACCAQDAPNTTGSLDDNGNIEETGYSGDTGGTPEDIKGTSKGVQYSDSTGGS